MISRAETGLSIANYAALQAATGNLAVKDVLQRYGPVWTSHEDGGPSGSGENFDAALTSTYAVWAYASGASTIEVKRLPDESGGDESWAAITCATITDLDTDVPISLITSGLTARIFYYTTDGKIKYSECADITTDAFGAVVEVGTVANVIQLAAVSTTKLYYITQNSNNNRVFHVYEYNGSWSSTSSDIYWPFPIYGFDAVAYTDFDLLMMSTELSPLLGSRAIGTEVTTEVNRVQGLATFRVENGRWSDHDVVDVIDKVETSPSRDNLRLSFVNGILFATYTRCGGADDHTYSKLAVVRSKDGVNWEFPELLDTITSPAVILPRTDYLYDVGISKVMRSPCCAWAGQTPVELDVTDYTVSIDSQAAEIRNSNASISNPDGVLNGTLARSDDRIQAVHSLGYVVGADTLRIEVSTEDIMGWSHPKRLPHQGLSLSSQDRLGRVNRITSDYAAEWPTQQAGRDTYDDPTGTGYGGMRHTAPYDGHWKTPKESSNELHLKSSNKEGLAVSTFVTDALNGSDQTAFKLHTDSEGEYAGLTFRVFDKDNLFFVAYYLDDNVIKLVKGVGGTDARDDTVLATSDVMSPAWVKNTWYWLKVRVRYSLVYVYYSADGITWTLLSTGGFSSGYAELAGTPNITAMSSLYNWSGKFGLIGYGYSDDDTWPDITPDPWDWPEPDYPLNKVIILTSQGVFYTETFEEASPTWLACNNNLSAAERQSMQQISYDYANGKRLFMVNSYGAYRCSNVWDSDAWDLRFDNAYAITALNVAGGPCTPHGGPGIWSCVNCGASDGHLEFIAGGNLGDSGCGRHKRAFYSSDSLGTVAVGDDLRHDPCPGDCGHAGTFWAGCVSRDGGSSCYSYVCGWAYGADAHRGYSSSGGATVTTSGSYGGQLASWSGSHPYQTRVGGTVIFFLSGSTRLCFSGDGGVTFTQQDSILPLNPMDTKAAMSLHRLDTSKVMYVSSGRALRRSSDGAYTWGTCPKTVTNPQCVTWAATNRAGASAGEVFIVGCYRPVISGFVHWTLNFGRTWTDKTGDLGTYLDVSTDHVYDIIPVGP